MICGGIRTKGVNKKSTVDRPLITVVTVVYNGEKTLEQTILSVINQTYDNVEYIIIDGNSTDKTIDIIKKYEDKIDYWQSEPDKGIYDAMNKGIDLATGDWINFMNSGDLLYDSNVLKDVFYKKNYKDVDVIYGNSVAFDLIKNEERFYFATEDICKLSEKPIYRHGSSFVKSEIHKNNKFDLSMSNQYKYALDYLCIFTLYKQGFKFLYINRIVMKYDSF